MAPSDRPDSKVANCIDRYGLDGLGDELERRWTADGPERLSLRDCAALFNRRLLEATLRAAGSNALRRDVERTYEQLTDEDVTAGVRTETRTRLSREGVDVDALERDFVTYQAIRSYLTEYRDATYEGPSDAEKVQSDIESIQRLLSRTLSVTEDRIESLQATGRLDIDSFDVLLEAQVLCQDCGSQYSVTELLEARGCDCQRA
ncbi:rod-determining factor RdfA [Haloarcula salinisoli]|uniref:Uncharacterized protein n=1 Tax=Haloarcula salinisoli TaxID=2487746 RepID=A0A8J7YB19_9EURY|nr:rod-determining factor RdfA [Halomicroarcula salinisoli]MBX0285751.1 hypothetical protein [Halomicroarcula salinisoli]MBX0302760.1 hypothetical protein [Halomicroarcula salinisoli]